MQCKLIVFTGGGEGVCVCGGWGGEGQVEGAKLEQVYLDFLLLCVGFGFTHST